MAKILYGVAGEGRGHASRARAIIEQLRHAHRIVVFAPDDAFDLLAPLYAETDVRVVRIPGLRFAYRANRALSPWRTARGALAYLASLPSLVDRLERAIDEEQPDLVISDFEPSLPRAALRRGVPFVSLDHQHFLIVSDFSHLPRRLQVCAAFLGRIVDLFYSGQKATIVSSFCFPGVRAGIENAIEVGPMLRPGVLEAKREHGNHLIAYVRKFASSRLINALRATGREVRFYGLGKRPQLDKIRFHAIEERRFVEDLATSHALVTTAGNQLLGEALYLQKPVLALPEPNNAEQSIHAHLLALEGTGEQADFDRIDEGTIRNFLSEVDRYRARIVPERMNGNAAALAELHRHLPMRATA